MKALRESELAYSSEAGVTISEVQLSLICEDEQVDEVISIIRKIGKIKSLDDRLFSSINLLAHSWLRFLLNLKLGYFPVIIILNNFFICGNIYMYYSNK